MTVNRKTLAMSDNQNKREPYGSPEIINAANLKQITLDGDNVLVPSDYTGNSGDDDGSSG